MKNIIISAAILILSSHLLAQDTPIQKTIFTKDSLFWVGYNECDIGKMQQFLADDVEFYHDKGGITLGKDALLKSVKDNLCSNKNFKTRREALPGTVKIFELKNGNETYGAIITGEHYFFNTYDGNPEKREGLARFTQLWILKDSTWKMTRILSYDHHAAPYQNLRKEVQLPGNVLARYKGLYIAPHAGQCTVVPEKNGLLLSIGNQKYQLSAESETTFFRKDRDLTFEFIKNQKNETLKFIVSENGKIVEEAIKK